LTYGLGVDGTSGFDSSTRDTVVAVIFLVVHFLVWFYSSKLQIALSGGDEFGNCCKIAGRCIEQSSKAGPFGNATGLLNKLVEDATAPWG
jgi:hypothetical protein